MTQYIVRGGSGDAGWEHGLPPSLTPAAWPRHRANGLPLVQKPVPDEEKLSYSADEDERVIQLGQPLNWVQAEVDGFGECVMEIEDDVGRANYGTGNCQIDLENSLLDWAC